MNKFAKNFLIFLSIMFFLTFGIFIIFFMAFKLLNKSKFKKVFLKLRQELRNNYVDLKSEVQDFENAVYDNALVSKVEDVIEKPLIVIKEQALPKIKKAPVKNKVSSLKVSYSKLNDRQDKLLKYIKTHRKASMNDVESMFSGVTQRTLRRDFERLEREGLVKQVGSTRNSVYVLV